jgi:hypothetical protein
MLGFAINYRLSWRSGLERLASLDRWRCLFVDFLHEVQQVLFSNGETGSAAEMELHFPASKGPIMSCELPTSRETPPVFVELVGGKQWKPPYLHPQAMIIHGEGGRVVTLLH